MKGTVHCLGKHWLIAVLLFIWSGAILSKADEPDLQSLIANGRYAEAVPIYEEIVEAWRVDYGDDPIDESRDSLAQALIGLGHVLDSAGLPEGAVEIFQEARELLGKSELTPATRGFLGECLYGLCVAYQRLHRLTDAERCLTEAVKLNSESSAIKSSVQLALSELMAGRFEQAEERLLGLQDRLSDSPINAVFCHNGLGRHYHSIRSFSKAIKHFEIAISLAEQLWGKEDHKTLQLMAQAGLSRLRTGDLVKARAALEQSYHLALEMGDPRAIANQANNLAQVDLQTGDLTSADTLLSGALDTLRQVLAADDAALAPVLLSLGVIKNRRNDLRAAQPLLEEALQLCQRLDVSHSQLRAETHLQLALCAFDRGALEAAATHGSAHLTEGHKLLAEVVSFGSENQKLNYQRDSQYLALVATIGQDPMAIANGALATKGVVLDSILRDRASASEALTRKKALLDYLTNHPDSAAPDQLEALRREIRLLQEGAVTVPEWGSIRSALPSTGALIDFVLYDHYLGKSQWEPRYGAIVISPMLDRPHWIPLAAHRNLTTWMSHLEKGLQGTMGEIEGKTTQRRPVIKLHQVLRQLHRRFWQPIEAVLPQETDTILLSPDGALHYLPFAVLLDSDSQFLSQSYQKGSYVSSPRDLLERESEEFPERWHWAVYLAEGFQTNRAQYIPPESLTEDYTRELLEILGSIKALPGVRTEFAELKRISVGHGDKLTELQTLTELDSTPQVLHLSTHAFFAPVMDVADTDVRAYKRSGLVLKHIERTLEALERGNPLSAKQDQVLFSDEIAHLDLKGTWLVTLSSCQTGLGQVWPGEGVMGLKRGFTLAGAQNLLTTLWPVHDRYTPQLMADFYSSARKTKEAGGALWTTQREHLVRLRAKQGLESAVLLAGPFVLNERNF